MTSQTSEMASSGIAPPMVAQKALLAMHHDNRTDISDIQFPTIPAKTDSSATMQALQFQGTENVKVGHVPAVLVTDPTDAVIKMTASTICGSDLHLYHKEFQVCFHTQCVRLRAPVTCSETACNLNLKDDESTDPTVVCLSLRPNSSTTRHTVVLTVVALHAGPLTRSHLGPRSYWSRGTGWPRRYQLQDRRPCGYLSCHRMR